jgi:hypothetical protein
MTPSYTLDVTQAITTEIDVDKVSEAYTIYVSVRANVISFAGVPLQHYTIHYQNIHVALPKNAIYLFKHRR